jgi:hypothetical protein
MSIDTPSIPPGEEPKKKNKLLWGCLIALVLVFVILCCGVTLIFMPLFSDYDPLGTGLREQIEEFIPSDYLDDTSSFPDFEDLLDETGSDGGTTDPGPSSDDFYTADEMPLAWFDFLDIGIYFYYPEGWDIEVEGYEVTFYDPESFTFVYIGELLTDMGTTAEEISQDFLDSVQEDAQEGTYRLISSDIYSVNIADDAYLTLFEWVDLDGNYAWAYDLEIVSGESNIFIFLYGEDPDEILFYGELLDIIASSMESVPELEESIDA